METKEYISSALNHREKKQSRLGLIIEMLGPAVILVVIMVVAAALAANGS